MNVDADLVNTWTEPQLFPSGGLAVTLECLIDLEERTVLFVCTTRDVAAGKLVALWSSSPQPVENYTTAYRRSSSEFADQVLKQTGPFP